MRFTVHHPRRKLEAELTCWTITTTSRAAIDALSKLTTALHAPRCHAESMWEGSLPDGPNPRPAAHLLDSRGALLLLSGPVMQRRLALRITRIEVESRLGMAVRRVKRAPSVTGEGTPPDREGAIEVMQGVVIYGAIVEPSSARTIRSGRPVVKARRRPISLS